MSTHHDSSGHANQDDEIARGAKAWMLGAGTFAVALSIFLALTDYGLSHSKKEQILGSTLRELRTAQTTMHSRVPDGRQTFDPNEMHSQEK